MKTLLMAFFYLTLMAYPAKAPVYSPSPFELVFGYCGIRDPCFIAPNNGGQVYLFVQAARAVNRGDKNLVVINTACASACALFADMARERVCIGELAVFQFHKGTSSTRPSSSSSKLPTARRWRCCAGASATSPARAIRRSSRWSRVATSRHG